MYNTLQTIISSSLQPLRRPICPMPSTSLRTVIAEGKFPYLTNAETVILFAASFPAELEHLRNASATVESASSAPLGCCDGKSPSSLICGAEYAEINRTLTSMLALKWLLADDYGSFVRGQPDGERRLTTESFQRMRGIFAALSDEEVYALLVALIIDDIGKDHHLSTAEDLNHSEIVFQAAISDRIPALSDLPDPSRQSILQSLQIGTQLNLSQLVQAECPPASLSVLRTVTDPRAFEIRAMVTLLDVAGAGAHRDARGCAMFTEPVCRAYLRAINAARAFLHGSIPTERACYDLILSDRADWLHRAGFALLSPLSPDERALLRLLCMGRVERRLSAEVFRAAFDALTPSVRRDLVDGLAVDGIRDGVAVVPYYAPGLLAEVLRGCHGEKAALDGLSAFLRFLARVFSSQPRSEGTGVVERDLSFIQDVIKGPAFAQDPSILDAVRLD